jgi:pimeloyl-ACP methyl ester carboxylesterase
MRIEGFKRGDYWFDVHDHGDSDGEPFVLLHGFPGGIDTWVNVIPGLVAAGYRVLAFDQRATPPARARST